MDNDCYTRLPLPTSPSGDLPPKLPNGKKRRPIQGCSSIPHRPSSKASTYSRQNREVGFSYLQHSYRYEHMVLAQVSYSTTSQLDVVLIKTATFGCYHLRAELSPPTSIKLGMDGSRASSELSGATSSSPEHGFWKIWPAIFPTISSSCPALQLQVGLFTFNLQISNRGCYSAADTHPSEHPQTRVAPSGK